MMKLGHVASEFSFVKYKMMQKFCLIIYLLDIEEKHCGQVTCLTVQIYMLLTEREIKMARYRPSSFFYVFLNRDEDGKDKKAWSM